MIVLTNEVLMKIKDERFRQNKKWGDQHHSLFMWLAILQEEIGEAVKEALNDTSDDDNPINELLVNELIQCAAVIVACIEDHTRKTAV